MQEVSIFESIAAHLLPVYTQILQEKVILTNLSFITHMIVGTISITNIKIISTEYKNYQLTHIQQLYKNTFIPQVIKRDTE